MNRVHSEIFGTIRKISGSDSCSIRSQLLKKIKGLKGCENLKWSSFGSGKMNISLSVLKTLSFKTLGLAKRDGQKYKKHIQFCLGE